MKYTQIEVPRTFQMNGVGTYLPPQVLGWGRSCQSS